tara:strand:- start:5540 stop:5866 length:327 start_codon:yes stop_codon:yes gene_type:complete
LNIERQGLDNPGKPDSFHADVRHPRNALWNWNCFHGREAQGPLHYDQDDYPFGFRHFAPDPRHWSGVLARNAPKQAQVAGVDIHAAPVWDTELQSPKGPVAPGYASDL